LRQEASQPPRLYAKPADRWEVNEVADRCGDVVEQSLRALAAYESWQRTGGAEEFPALPDLLLRPEE
jgi:hypothetical protein